MRPRRLGWVAATAIFVCAGACAGAVPPPAADRSSPTLHLTGFEKTFDCREVRGELVVLIKPEIGALILSATEFPGAERVGVIEGTRVQFSFPSLRLREQSANSAVTFANPLQLWGMSVLDIDPQVRPGCFGMDRPKNVDADELEALIRRQVIDL